MSSEYFLGYLFPLFAVLLPLKVSRALSRALLQSNRKRLARSIVPVKQVLILRMPRNKHSPPTKPQFRLMTLANIHFSLDFCGGIREADLIAPAASHHTHLYSWHGAVSNLCLIFILFYYGVTFFFDESYGRRLKSHIQSETRS